MTHWPNADDNRPFGIDVARYNPVDWRTVAGFRAPAVEICVIRWGQAMQGAYDDIDRKFFFNWANASFGPLGRPWRRMGYHVFYPASAVAPQVANVKRIGRLVGNAWGDPPFWIDLELNQGLYGAPIIDRCKEFKDGLEQLMGMPVGIYSGKWFIDKYALPIRPWWSETWWWLAQYAYQNAKESGPLTIPNGVPAERVLYHQTTSNLEGCLFGAPLGTRIDGNRQLNPYGG